MTYDRTAYRWLGVCAVVIAILLLCSIVAFAQFSDVYGDVSGDVFGDVRMTPPTNAYADPSPIIAPYSNASPIVQFSNDGPTYIYPGVGKGPAVIVPPIPQGQSYLYFGQGGAPDVIVTPNGKVLYQWNGRK